MAELPSGESASPLDASLPSLRLVSTRLGALPGGRLAQQAIVAAESIALRLPGAAWVLGRVAEVERAVIGTVGRRLAGGAGTASMNRPDSGGSSNGVVSPSLNGSGPGRLFQALIERGMEQTAEEARADALARIVRSLVPDEAKVLVWLAGSETRPVIHVNEAAAIGGNSVTLVRNVSGASRSAGVRSREMASLYIDHLLELGLVEFAPEAPDKSVEYEILEAETQVREAIAHLEHSRMRRAKINRQSLRLTPLGYALWSSYAGEPLA